MKVTAGALLTLLGGAAAAGSYNATSGSDTTCVCTTVPCPVSGDNYLTEGGGSTGTYNYIMNADGIALVSAVSVTITPADLDQGTETTSCTQAYSRSMDDDGVEDCDAGHILAHRLGGPGNQPINIFPQSLGVNRGAFAQFEGDIYECVAEGASSASLSWSFEYSSTERTKPDTVTYTAKFTGGSCETLSEVFDNTAR